ncbi:MAG: hypothetical protein IJB10_01145 [Clostridia bacterium]|nr:hypothetical protein [Clostridia bacterium]
MKKLICNLCSIALGVTASVICFLPIFDVTKTIGDTTIWYNTKFSLFTEANKTSVALLNYSPTLKIVCAIIAGFLIAFTAAIILLSLVDLFKGKKAKNTGLKKIIGLFMFLLSILFVVFSLLFMNNHSVEIAGTITKIDFVNLSEYLVIPIGYALSGVFALIADNK